MTRKFAEAEKEAEAPKTPAIAVRLRRDAAEQFEAATRKIVGRRVVVTLDDYLIGAPVVEAPITGGEFRIPLGKHPPPTRERAETIALVLTAGEPLPFPLRLLHERRVPPRARGRSPPSPVSAGPGRRRLPSADDLVGATEDGRAPPASRPGEPPAPLAVKA